MLRVAEQGFYQPLWSDRILGEAQAAIEEIHPGIDVHKRFTQMGEAFEEATVAGWQALERTVSLPDSDDRHVVAAALRGGAQVIVTFNLRDFPQASIAQFGLSAVHPDDFLLDQFDLDPAATLQVIYDQAAHTSNPCLSAKDLVVLLSRAGVPNFADEIRRLGSRPLNW